MTVEDLLGEILRYIAIGGIAIVGLVILAWIIDRIINKEKD